MRDSWSWLCEPSRVIVPTSPIHRLAAARAISVAGSQIALIALTYRIYEVTGSAVWVSAVFLATFATLGVMTPIGGWLGDRFDRRAVMIASDVAAAGVFVALFFVETPWLLVAFALIATIAEVPFLPASQAAIPNLVAERDLARANGFVTQAYSVGITVGPLFGGVLVGAAGASAAFAINAVTFLVSAGLIWSIRRSFQERGGGVDETPVALPITEGIRAVRRSRVLGLVVLAEVVAYSVIGWAIVSDAPLADYYDAGAIGFGALVSTWGLGMLIGSWATGRWMGERAVEVPVLFAGMVGSGVMVLMMGLSPVFALVLVSSVLGGVGSGAVNVARQVLLQRTVPDRLRARVFGVVEALATASFVIGLATAGPVVEVMGVRAAYAASGVVLALGALILLPLLVRPSRPDAPSPLPIA
jgi:MFS family permease